MTLDIHTHYFTAEYLQNLDRYVGLKESRDYLEGVVLKNLARAQSGTATFENYLGAMNKNHIGQAMVFGLSDTAVGCRHLNDQVHLLTEEHPHRILGFGTIPLLEGMAAIKEELQHIGTELGFRGIKIYPSMSKLRFTSDTIIEVLAEAAALDLVVLTDCSFVCWENPGYFGTDNKFYELLEALNRLEDRPKVIAAHLGGGLIYFRDMYKLFGSGDYDNVWFDISPFFPASMIKAAMEIVGAERLLFGSDFPFSDGSENLAALAELNLSPREERVILEGNALEVLGLNGEHQ